MKISYLTTLCVFVAGALLVTGCFEENKPVIDGPPTFGFNGDEGVVWDGDGAVDGSGTFSAEIMLVSPQQSSDLQARFEVVGDETDAIEGTNYSFSGDAAEGLATIPANSSLADLNIDILFADMVPGTSRTLTLQLVEGVSAGVEIAANFDTFELTIDALRAIVDTDQSAYDFGEVDPDGLITEGSDSTKTIVISNTGNRASDLSDFAITGDGADAFSFDFDEEYTLEADEDVEIEVTFAPGEEGEFEAEFSFVWTMGTGDPEGAEHSVTLTGATPDDNDGD